MKGTDRTPSCLAALAVLAGAVLGGCAAGNAAPDVLAPALTPEEARAPAAVAAMPALTAPTAATSRALAQAIPDFPGAATAVGSDLWRRERERLQLRGELDDRPLYWSRLAALATLARDCPPRPTCKDAVTRFELASRGALDTTFSAGTPLRILLTGFDPFGLDRHIDQSNPSGVAALALDGRVIGVGKRRAEIQSLLFPVRFVDFDEGLVERVLEPLLQTGTIDYLVTLSMGRDAFDLERFPGRRRSAEAPDNLSVRTGASAQRPLIPRLGDGPLPGPEFVEFSLPAAAMMRVQSPWPVRDNHRVTTLERGTFEAASLDELDDQTAVRGGGGGYLSNEISFRTVRLVRELGLDLVVGHIHTPRIEGFDTAALASILDQIEALLSAAVEQTPEP
ncbi:MAG: hypothetical protein V2I63_03710 [Pseudomonadales bacterium]|jgi:pyrrolidone-carboxylate peptidase|nr:hypothetical protein [Pseudomonadales bacterium]